MKLTNILLNKISNRLKFRRVSDLVLFNVNSGFNKKNALLVYLNSPFFKGPQDKKYHTSELECIGLINTLSTLGYNVDVADVFGCSEIILPKVAGIKYDVILGFGDLFSKVCDLNPKCEHKILYCTENEPEFSFSNESKRLDYFYKRHNKKLSLSRSGVFYRANDFYCSSHLLTLADKKYFTKFKKDVFELYPTGLINSKFCISKKIEANSNDFLWFGSKGVVHKGLDLLVESFDGLDCNSKLYICGADEKELAELSYKSKNIYNLGRINVNSDDFLELAYKCKFIILPSCSEGFSTSITTAMLHGIIPVISKGIGMDRLGNLAYFISEEDLNIEGFKAYLKSLVKKRVLDQEIKSVHSFARNNFVIESYIKHTKLTLENILNERK